ncbi:MAG: MarR family winged helix-turn-helix transcriptional regulator [Candidatus Omnitrophica bacterium]|nr:MarR family winged helix-turn-helix transcriptional regulator [Candidatus Omnitrophota bacterium]
MATIDAITKEISIMVPKIARHAHAGTFSKINITPAQILMLIFIKNHGQCKLKTLAKERKISPPTATGLIDRLVKGSYVKRGSDPEDRRVVMVSLTKKGENVVGRHLGAIQDLWKGVLIKLSQKEQEQYLHILRKIVAILSSEDMSYGGRRPT